MHFFSKKNKFINQKLIVKVISYKYGGPSLGGEELVASPRPLSYCYTGNGRMVLPPIMGTQNLEFKWRVSVLPKEINFRLPLTYLKFYRFKSGQGGCLSRERWRGGPTASGALGGPHQTITLFKISKNTLKRTENLHIHQIKLGSLAC